MKRYLADTHAVLWFAAGQVRRFGPAAKRAFATLGPGSVEIAVSVVSLWEIAMLNDDGDIRLAAGFTKWCDALLAIPGLVLETLKRDDIERARSVRVLRDPHDRLIAGTALRLGVPLITAEGRMSASGRVATIW